MLKQYSYKGLVFQFEEGKQPTGAIEITKTEEKEAAKKDKAAPKSNKAARKANK